MRDQHNRDSRLLDACRDGDAEAWRELIGRYERLVFSIPLQSGLSREDAADICQLSFTALLEQLDTVRDGTRVGAWLATVARRHTWRLVARSRREVTVPEPVFDVAQNHDDIADLERLLWLYDGLLAVDARCRELLLALYFDPAEPGYVEVARRLGRPVGSIGPTRARCLRRLRAALD